MMKKKSTIEQRILALKIGQSFMVKTEGERKAVLNKAATLNAIGRLKHSIKSTTCAAGFKIYAI